MDSRAKSLDRIFLQCCLKHRQIIRRGFKQIPQDQFMIGSDYGQTPLMELKCGCLINEVSGELHQECLPHEQANFMQ